MKKFKNLDFILLVDDDEATNFYNQEIINNCDFDVNVICANDGKEALDFLSNRGQYESQSGVTKKGIIFLDINMPIMNGWEFLEKYENLPIEQKSIITVLMLSTTVNPEDLEKAKKEKEVKGFIFKPMTEDYIEKFVLDNFTMES